MKFFKPEDFDDPEEKYISFSLRQWNANLANAKLEREGKTVYCSDPDLYEITRSKKKTDKELGIIPSNYRNSNYKALLINIEPIEKCTHPNERIGQSFDDKGFQGYVCSCGVKVKPTRWIEI